MSVIGIGSERSGKEYTTAVEETGPISAKKKRATADAVARSHGKGVEDG